MDFSSAHHVSIETCVGNPVDRSIFWILVDKQHSRTPGNMVLHIYHAVVNNILVIVAMTPIKIISKAIKETLI